jgi:arabinogalactan endo-1,4-beta-galactosidase
MRAAGARVDMAIIGNETSYGMMWPTGQLPLEDPADPNKKGIPAPDPAVLSAAYDRFAPLLKAGIAGAKAADPDIIIQIHHHVGHNWDMCRDWLDALMARGVAFDVFGISCYQQENEGDWEKTLKGFVGRYPGKGVLVGEYSSRKRYVNDLVHDLPGKRGWGTFIWEPTRHQEAIFDRNGFNAGGGARPNLLRQGTGPGTPPLPPGMAPARPAANAPRRQGTGGRYDANPILWRYREIARDYGL